MRRGDLFWADVGPYGRRPVCVLTRDRAVPVLHAVVCAAVTRRIRGIPSEVEVGRAHGLPDDAVITCDNLLTVPKSQLDPEPIGHLDLATRAQLDETLRYALGIVF